MDNFSPPLNKKTMLISVDLSRQIGSLIGLVACCLNSVYSFLSVFVIRGKSSRGIRTSGVSSVYRWRWCSTTSVGCVCLKSVSSRRRKDVFVLALSCPVTRVTLMPDPAFRGKVVKGATPEKKKLPSDSVLVAASLHFCLHGFICHLWKCKLCLKHPGWPPSSLCLRANSDVIALPPRRSFDYPMSH